MRSSRKGIALVLGMPILIVPILALAQSSGGNFTLRKSVVTGGTVAVGGSYRLTASASLHAGVQNGGAYRLTSGFHAPRQASVRLFCDGFESTPCP